MKNTNGSLVLSDPIFEDEVTRICSQTGIKREVVIDSLTHSRGRNATVAQMSANWVFGSKFLIKEDGGLRSSFLVPDAVMAKYKKEIFVSRSRA